jgi:hypothetical protein
MALSDHSMAHPQVVNGGGDSLQIYRIAVTMTNKDTDK